MDRTARIELGKIVSAHGLRGEVNYIPFNSDSELPFPGMEIELVPPQKKPFRITVESIREKGKTLIIRVNGYDDRTSAETLRGALLTCSRDDLPELDDGDFYYRDAIGLPAVYPDGEPVGKVIDVLSLATDVIEIRTADGQDVMLPAVKGFVRSIGPDSVVVEPGALEME